MCHIFFIHPLVEGHLDLIQVLAILNYVDMNKVDQVFFVMIEHPLGNMPESGNAVLR